MYVFQVHEVNDEPEESDCNLVGKAPLPNDWNAYFCYVCILRYCVESRFH